MYDPKAEAHEFLGDSRDDAVAKAVQYYGLEPDELTIKEYAESGVSGLGGRVLIVAQPTAAIGTIQTSRGDDRGDRGRRDRGDRGDRGRRDRGDRGGRGRERGRDRDRERPQPQAEAVAPPAEDLGPSEGTAKGEIGTIGEFILGVIERMGLGPFEIAKETEEEKFVVYQVTGPAASGLTAGDGRTPDAIQLLANQAAARAEEEPKRVILDVAGNRGRRDEFLERIAERAAQRATETGRTVALEPMSPGDRRIIHVALRERDGVVTMSRGEGRYRQVLVVPEGAAEYDEARAASEGSGD